MGMYDELICEIALPVKGLEGEVFQTKSLPCPSLDLFKIGEDKQLYEQEYDVVDRSDPDAEGILRLAGMATRTNKRFVKNNFTGEIRFYTYIETESGSQRFEFSSYFIDGRLKAILQIREGAAEGLFAGKPFDASISDESSRDDGINKEQDDD
jgi:hypothetical protein